MDKRIDWQELAARLFCLLVFGAAALALPIAAFRLLAPFMAAALVCAIVIPAARAVSRFSGIGERVCRIFMLIIGFLMIALAVFVAARHLYAEAIELLGKIYSGEIELEILKIRDREMLEGAEQLITEAATGFLSSLVDALATALKSLAGSVASILLFAVAFVSSCIYICLDYEKLTARASEICGNTAARLKDGISAAIGGYLRASVLLFVLVFALAFVGLCVLGQKYALTAAVVIALVDLVPVLGTGIVLLPWALYALLGGHVGLGIGLTVLWLVITVVRSAAEPRIIGSSIGLPPLVSLVAVYVGFKIFGVIGMITAPVAAAVIQCMVRHKPSPDGIHV